MSILNDFDVHLASGVPVISMQLRDCHDQAEATTMHTRIDERSIWAQNGSCVLAIGASDEDRERLLGRFEAD